MGNFEVGQLRTNDSVKILNENETLEKMLEK